MPRLATCLLVIPLVALAQETGDVTFRSDVSLVRVDVQVHQNGRAVTGLRAQDFELRDQGQLRRIRNFSADELPVDFLLLLDVSGSMRPHVETVARASHTALGVLGLEDRVAIMVFDTYSRVRMPFRSSREDVERELENLINQEHFNGGTDITRAMKDAIRYISREPREDTRRAIVILTDDRTGAGRDDKGIIRELAKNEIVMSALIAPDAMGQYSGYPIPRGGGGWPGGSRRGGIIVPPIGGPFPGPFPGPGRIPGGGPNIPIGGPGMDRMQSAGTSEIARASGGDSLAVDYASSLERTFANIRQRYTLHFLEPLGTQAGEERTIEVTLTEAARRRYPNAELRFRTVYIAQGAGADDPPPTEVSANSPDQPGQPIQQDAAPVPASRRRRAVDESTGSAGPKINEPKQPASGSSDEQPQRGGWRRLKPGEKPE